MKRSGQHLASLSGMWKITRFLSRPAFFFHAAARADAVCPDCQSGNGQHCSSGVVHDGPVVPSMTVTDPLGIQLSRMTDPRGLDPSVKLMVPLGVPLPDTEFTMADNVTVCPNELGFGELVKPVVLPLLFTVCVMAGEAEA